MRKFIIWIHPESDNIGVMSVAEWNESLSAQFGEICEVGSKETWQEADEFAKQYAIDNKLAY